MPVMDHSIAVVVPFPWDRSSDRIPIPRGWKQVPGEEEAAFNAHLAQKYHAYFLRNMHPDAPSDRAQFVPEASTKLKIAEVGVVLSGVEFRSFSGGIGMLTMFFLLDDREADLAAMCTVAGVLRDPGGVVHEGSAKDTLGGRAAALLGQVGADPSKLTAFGPHFKVFVNVVMDADRLDDGLWDEHLFELATGLPQGGMRQANAPTVQYMRRTIDDHGLHLFGNWRALALFDTFTRLALRSEDPFQSWRKDYLCVYQYAIMLRAQAMRLSTRLADTTLSDVRLLDLRDEWMTFRNEVDLRFVSYKWLPNELFTRMMAGANVLYEVQRTDERLERMVQRFKERRNRNLIRAGLILVALLIVALFVFSGA